MSLRARVCLPVLASVLLVPQARGVDNPLTAAAAPSESTAAGGATRFEQDLAEHVLLRRRVNVLHPNPQSIFEGSSVAQGRLWTSTEAEPHPCGGSRRTDSTSFAC
jgi:hypothetical protein